MQSLSGRENLHNVCRQEGVSEQEDRNHAEVSAQGRPLAKKKVIGNFLKTVKSTNATLQTPQKIFQVKTTENISISKWYRINYFLVSASEDLRLKTSHETDGKADTSKGTGTALVFVY